MTSMPTHAPSDPAAQGPNTSPVLPARRRRTGKTLIAVLIVLATVVAVGYFAWLKLGREADSPGALADRFGQAGVTCTQRQAILDLGDTKTLWCGTTDGKAITVTTWAEDVDYDQWLRTHCAVVSGKTVDRGAAVVSEKWIIDVQRMIRKQPTAEKMARDLSGVLGGSVRTYDCARVR
jgi:hypothetical protein